MDINIPEFSLVMLIGSSSSGKTTFANKYFKKSEVLSSDHFRELISDDENNQNCSNLAFDSLFNVLNNRLKYRRLSVVDATNINVSDRNKILNIAKDNNVELVAIVFNLDLNIIKDFYNNRNDGREIEFDKVLKQRNNFLKIKNLKEEGFKYIYTLNTIEELDNAKIILNKLKCDKRDITGKFDIIGDIHGCYDELLLLIQKLGYNNDYIHPDNRKLIFLGDLCDRGPKNMDVLRLVIKLVKENKAYCIRGNHDHKFYSKYTKGIDSKTKLANGLDVTIEEFNKEPEEFKNEVMSFIKELNSYYVFDNNKLVVSHAGIKEEFINRESSRIFNFCLYGDVTGETDENGFPIRRDWAKDYKSKIINVYGHTPSFHPIIKNNTYCIDTGCVFGNTLTAFRYPEKELVSVKALKQYYDQELRPNNIDNDNLIENINFTDSFDINTNILGNITIRKNFGYNAIETLNRYSIENNFLIYLSPTMSPCETNSKDDYLEYPSEALNYYKSNNIDKVICEKKHMGSRCIIIVGKDIDSIKKRFNIESNTLGRIYSRSGRSFYDYDKEQKILNYISNILTERNFWDDFDTDWVIIDSEQLPWNEKAIELLKNQYAPVGISGYNGLSRAIDKVEEMIQNNILTDTNDLANDLKYKLYNRLDNIKLYIKEYQKYCWNINNIDDIKIAPFHILAIENKVFSNKDHLWHLDTIKKYLVDDDKIISTPHIIIDLTKENYINIGVEFWNDILISGGEGMVVKPLSFIAYNKDNNQLLQPAIKCRGRDYLRIIYGPDYLNNLRRLKERGLNKKRTLALKEFVLGIEALERFVNYDSLQRVYECIFGISALEGDYTDPRL